MSRKAVIGEEKLEADTEPKERMVGVRKLTRSFKVGGGRTYREWVGTMEILVGLQASQSMQGLHTTLSA